VLGGLVAAVAVAAPVTYVLSERTLRRPVVVPEHPAPAAADFAATPAAVTALAARGGRLVAQRGCAGCHGANLGGQLLGEDVMMGRLSTPNLTAGGRGAALDDRAWELALRHGVRRDGTPLLVMPSGEYAAMTDEEVAAVVAYARALPPVRTSPPALRPGPVPRLVLASGGGDFVAAHAIAERAARAAADGGHVAHASTAATPARR
jgi:mono/diheme cytochrome c family protein